MRHAAVILLATLLLLTVKADRGHAFYVSITELVIQDDTLQISLRIFTDDLEDALNEGKAEKTFLNQATQNRQHFVLIKDYVSSRFGAGHGAKEGAIQWLGHEYEDDVCWIYGQWPISKDQRLLFIRNEILTELHSQQQNLVHFETKNGIETKLATKQSPEVRFAIGT
jgi:hypothetical protein